MLTVTAPRSTAYVLRPDVVLDISTELVKTKTHYERKKAALLAFEHIRSAHEKVS